MLFFLSSRKFAGLKTCALAALVLVAVAGGFPLFQKISAQEGPGWSLVDIGLGVGNSLGEVIFGSDGSSLKVTSQAKGYAPEGDELTWVGEQMPGDKASLAVLMTSVEGAGWQGITLRKNLEVLSDGVFLGLNPEGKLGLLTQPDGEWLEMEGTPEKLKNGLWLKLEKVGPSIGGYYSEDGKNWDFAGAVELESADSIHAGVVVAGTGAETNGVSGNPASAHFNMVTVEEAAPQEPAGTESEAPVTGGGLGSGGNPGAGGDGVAGGEGSAASATPESEKEALKNFLARGQGPVIYVNNLRGNDAWDGRKSLRETGSGNGAAFRGPKYSLKKAWEAAEAAEGNEVRIVIFGNALPYEAIDFPKTEKNVTIFAVGNTTMGAVERSRNKNSR